MFPLPRTFNGSLAFSGEAGSIRRSAYPLAFPLPHSSSTSLQKAFIR
jgi:hypothetical protein